jgi:hypothetical protein
MIALAVIFVIGASTDPAQLDWYSDLLRAAPVGSWSRYEVKTEHERSVQQFSLLDRRGDEVTLQIATYAPEMANAPLTTLRFTVSAARPANPPTELAIRVRGAMPMRLPKERPPNLPTLRSGGISSSRTRPITVPAGRFVCTNQSEILENGTRTTWTSTRVAPLGIVKLIEHKHRSQSPTTTMTLISHGTGDTPPAWTHVRPFEEAALLSDMLRAQSHAATH